MVSPFNKPPTVAPWQGIAAAGDQRSAGRVVPKAILREIDAENAAWVTRGR
jgi:hypothetical protein